MYRQDCARFLFEIGGKISDKESFQIVEEEHYSGIPSSKPNLYLLVQKKSGAILRILANIEHSRLGGAEEKREVWLSAQICDDEKSKYGKHTDIHGFFMLSESDRVVSLCAK